MSGEESVKLLLVDDEDMVREVCTAILNKAGFNVITAINGLEALEMIQKESYSLVVLDVNMPKLDGIDLYKTVIKTKPEMRDKFLFITGDLGGEVDALGVLLQSDIVIMRKPFTKEDLLVNVRLLLARGSGQKA